MQHVPRFFTDEVLQSDKQITICDDNHHHIRNVLRMKQGEQALFFNGQSGEFTAKLISCDRHESIFILGDQTRPQEDDAVVWLAVGILKADMMGLLIEKATELQVAKIMPFASSGSSEKCNVEKLRSRALKASQQCERLTVPEIASPRSLQELDFTDRHLFAAIERGNHPPLATSLQPKPSKPALLIGPAGGFSDAEISHITALPNCQPVSLGTSLLRAETAAIVSLSLLYALQ